MECETADLGGYIQSCYDDQHQCWGISDRVFDIGLGHLRPQLRSSRTNRILLYPGSFNPPHHGHEALLHQAFAGSQDRNVIAAIVVLLDDQDVEAKCRSLRQNLVLSKKERVLLWRGNGQHDWRWVYDGSEEAWHSFRRRLTDAITTDGFDLKFVALSGPDYIKRDSNRPWNAWDCEEIIVSNASRTADFITRRHGLSQLKGCEPWELVLYDDEESLYHAQRSVAFLAGGMSLLAPDRLRKLLDRDPDYFDHLIDDIRSKNKHEFPEVWVCARTGASTETIRFIPSKGQADNISSTRIRQIVEAGTHKTLRKRLEPFALNPDILVRIVQTRDRNSSSSLRSLRKPLWSCHPR